MKICPEIAVVGNFNAVQQSLRELLVSMGYTLISSGQPLPNEKAAVLHFVSDSADSALRHSTDGAFIIGNDASIISRWVGHPHLRLIYGENPMPRLETEIKAFLGDPEPLEIERKFLIEYPDVKWLEGNPFCGSAEILQTYLKPQSGHNVRLRQRSSGDGYLYFKTEKRSISPVKRAEYEERITAEEYVHLLMLSDTQRHQIRKTRYCLMYEGQYFEIDLFPFWQDRAIMELELLSEDQPISFPPEIRIIREVTLEPAYKNTSLSLEIPR